MCSWKRVVQLLVSILMQSDSWLTLFYCLLSDTGIREDCDVYIRSGVNPSYFSFEFFDVGVSESFEVVVENPQDQTWHIGVNGYTACDYRLKVTIM